MLCAIWDEVGVAWFEPLGPAFDRQGHLAFNEDAPLGTMAVGGDFRCGFYLEEDDLVVVALGEPGLHTGEWDVGLGEVPDQIRERGIKHGSHCGLLFRLW